MNYSMLTTFNPEEAEILKFDQERSIPDTMALKRFYLRSLYTGKDMDMSIEDWNKLCNKEFAVVKARKDYREKMDFATVANSWKFS